MAECPVCLDDVTDTYRTPCCGNQIHRGCLNECLRHYHACPLCRECYHVVEIEVPTVMDNATKWWMAAGMSFFGGVVGALFSIIYCNRVHHQD